MQSQPDDCLFCRLVREGSHVASTKGLVAVKDINPQAPVHILVIPKGSYVSWDDFSARASDAQIAVFVRAVGRMTPARR